MKTRTATLALLALVAGTVYGQDRDPCEGEPDGVKVTRDSRTVETPCFNGKRHGVEIIRDGTSVHETTYFNGKRHGIAIWRTSSWVVEVPWVNGKRHGTERRRWHDGEIDGVLSWVNGEKQPCCGDHCHFAAECNGEEQPDP